MIKAVICGATAVGKSEIACRLAAANGFEVISADSRQIYKGLEIGTCQVEASWRSKVPHHFMGFLDPAEEFSAHRFREVVIAMVKENPSVNYLVAGGTGMYIKALLYPQKEAREPVHPKIKKLVADKITARGSEKIHQELAGLDPEVTRKIHPNDAYRIAKAYETYLISGKSYRDFNSQDIKDPAFSKVPIIWLTRERSALYEIINSRILEMMNNGWIEEVKELMKKAPDAGHPCFNSLGYREVAEHISGRLSREKMTEKIQQLTRNYAKRQNTFFKHQFPEAEAWDYGDIVDSLESANWIWYMWQNGKFPS